MTTRSWWALDVRRAAAPPRRKPEAVFWLSALVLATALFAWIVY